MNYEESCADLHDKSTGLYLYGDLYVADEFMREMEYGVGSYEVLDMYYHLVRESCMMHYALRDKCLTYKVKEDGK